MGKFLQVLAAFLLFTAAGTAPFDLSAGDAPLQRSDLFSVVDAVLQAAGAGGTSGNSASTYLIDDEGNRRPTPLLLNLKAPLADSLLDLATRLPGPGLVIVSLSLDNAAISALGMDEAALPSGHVTLVLEIGLDNGAVPEDGAPPEVGAVPANGGSPEDGADTEAGDSMVIGEITLEIRSRSSSTLPLNSSNLPGAGFLDWSGYSGGNTNGLQDDPGVRIVDERVLLSTATYLSDGSLKSWRTYRYTPTGRFYEMALQESGTIRIYRISEAEGNFREEISNAEGEVLSMTEYDSQGRLSGSLGSGQNVSVEYRSDGSRIESEAVQEDGRSVLTDRVYSQDNLLLAETREENGVLVESRAFSYDSRGNLISEDVNGLLGNSFTEYKWNGDDLEMVSMYRNGQLVSTLIYEGSVSTEVRYIRGNAVLRIGYVGGVRMYEEELAGDRVIRRRDYSNENADADGEDS